jgi:hypothetical protein
MIFSVNGWFLRVFCLFLDSADHLFYLQRAKRDGNNVLTMYCTTMKV